MKIENFNENLTQKYELIEIKNQIWKWKYKIRIGTWARINIL